MRWFNYVELVQVSCYKTQVPINYQEKKIYKVGSREKINEFGMGVLNSWLMEKEDQALFIKEQKQLEASHKEEYYRPTIECLERRTAGDNFRRPSLVKPDSSLSLSPSSCDSGSGTQKTSSLIFNLQPHYSFLRLTVCDANHADELLSTCYLFLIYRD